MSNSSSPLSVTQLTRELKGVLESQFRQVSVKGEVTNMRIQASGHTYFSLKDATSQISIVLFARCRTASTPKFAEGDQIIVQGSIGVYEARGVYQIIARSVSKVGLGDLLLELQQRKEKLRQMGWFEPCHKKELPPYPKRIGVVTSPTGSVIQDIIHVLRRRSQHFSLTLNPVRVQGKEAALEIAQAIEDCNRYDLADVLIVGRGGGSLEDLWCFNEFCVVKAIFASKIPIVTAIGHETDTMLADFVSDIRAPTPSAAAEIVTTHTAELTNRLETLQQQIAHAMRSRIQQAKTALHYFTKNPLLTSPDLFLSAYMQKVDDMHNRIVHAFNWPQRLQQKRLHLNHIQNHLTDLHPHNILKKGYCIPLSENTHSVILSVKDISSSEALRLVFADGEALASINNITCKSEAP